MARVPAAAQAAVVMLIASAASAAGKAVPAGYPWKLALTDQQGKAFDLADASGRILVLSFLFTHCGSACPMQTSRLARVQGLPPESLKARSRFVSVSIDPARDCAAALAEYAAAFRIDPAHWRLGATPDTAAISRLVAALGVGLKPGVDGASDHEMAVFDGVIADAKVFTRALTTPEIRALAGVP